METQETIETVEAALTENSVEATGLKRNMTVFYVLRWVILLPVSFFIAFLSLLPDEDSITVWLLQFIGIQPESYAEKIAMNMSFFGFGLMFVFMGTVIAPNYKKVTSHVMYGICLLLICMMLISKGISIAPIFLFVGSSLGTYTFPVSRHRKISEQHTKVVKEPGL